MTANSDSHKSSSRYIYFYDVRRDVSNKRQTNPKRSLNHT